QHLQILPVSRRVPGRGRAPSSGTPESRPGHGRPERASAGTRHHPALAVPERAECPGPPEVPPVARAHHLGVHPADRDRRHLERVLPPGAFLTEGDSAVLSVDPPGIPILSRKLRIARRRSSGFWICKRWPVPAMASYS